VQDQKRRWVPPVSAENTLKINFLQSLPKRGGKKRGGTMGGERTLLGETGHVEAYARKALRDGSKLLKVGLKTNNE